MDLFEEARWTFSEEERADGFYQGIVQDLLIAPRLPRFGALRSSCTKACDFVITYRTNPELLGYPADVASPLSLLADVGDLEYSDPCRICIEEEYTATIEDLYANIEPTYSYLLQKVQDAMETDDDTKAELSDIAAKLDTIIQYVTEDDVVNFYSVYVARSLYGELGVESYLESYALFNSSIASCNAFGGWLGLSCPAAPDDIDAATATRDLLNHADNTFSSVSTSGAPFPFWSESDGTGALLKPNNVTGRLYPVSGSGINMSAPLNSLTRYFGFLFLQKKEVDPSSQEWQNMVATDPLFAWLMANLTLAEEGTGTL